MTTPTDLPLEQAFARLEAILESLNSGQPSLEQALTLYEEADKLILSCNQKLTTAERKIEMLTKNRNNELQLGPDQKPLTQPLQ